MAKRLIQRKFQRGKIISNPKDAAQFLPFKLATLEHESFWVLFLCNSHRVLAFEELSRGTINQSSIYPREVLKRSLQLNASALIFAHNHPSGNAEPSDADINITEKLKQALSLVDIKVLDHFIIAGDTTFSMAEKGLC
jgi:DNA repair protein RadC